MKNSAEISIKDEVNFGLTISKIRKKLRITQVELAEKVGTDQSFISLIEKNKKTPSIKTLVKIAKVLEIPFPLIMLLSITDENMPEDKKADWSMANPILRGLIARVFPVTERL